jgi:NDP-sugar pyrophosphorylase family protein
MITRAFVLAAGMGTRLRPLTDALPKPLVPIFQKPLITFALDHLIDAGVNSFVINTHRLPELFAAFLRVTLTPSTRSRSCTSRTCLKPAAESKMPNLFLLPNPS